eukprot:GCRY01001948.1.p1 GENE.GCRY01001948.1~~GCRY01001948.1.p1  ORF type:complete len:921 (+),score=223.92 GCRY01001948.1:332-2764(+)
MQDARNQLTKWDFGENIPKGRSILMCDWKAALGENMAGLYVSKYMVDGEKKIMVATQFEPCDARRCFPCFDVPYLKATFQMEVEAEAKHTVISNMPVEECETVCACEPESSHTETACAGTKRWLFQTTPKMSTYLVAVAVGEMHYIETASADGKPLRAYFMNEAHREQLRFALEMSKKSFDFFEKMFGIEYPLPKCDIIGIPEFSAGAMENWGLITYRENRLFVSPDNPSLASKKDVCQVVAHEISHSWFGNLVTMEWWDNLWLNEGFARVFEHYCADALMPEMRVWQQFVENVYSSVITGDSRASTHSILVEVDHPSEINQIFDVVTYGKGGCLCRMLFDFLGPDVAFKGLAAYLKEYSYQNTTHNDLWRKLSEASGVNVTEIMDPYIKEVGYPSVRFERCAEGLRLTQQRFVGETPGGGTREDPLWAIPISIRFSNSTTDTKLVLRERSAVVPFPGGESARWFFANPGCTSLFMPLYDDQDIKTLFDMSFNGTPEEKALFPAADRGSTLNFILRQVKLGRTSFEQFLDLCLLSLKNGFVFFDWELFETFCAVTRRTAQTEEQLETLRQFMRVVVQPALDHCGLTFKDDDTPDDIRFRILVFRIAFSAEHPTVVNHLKDLFNEFVLHRDAVESLNENIWGLVFAAGVKYCCQEAYDKLVHLYENHGSKRVTLKALSSLVGHPDPAFLPKVLAYIWDKVPAGDFIHPFMSMGAKTRLDTGTLVWDFFTTHFDELCERYAGTMLGKHIVSAATYQMCSEARYDTMKAFFDSHPCEGFERGVEHAYVFNGENMEFAKNSRLIWTKIEDVLKA